MLGYISAPERGMGDRLLAGVAQRLALAGFRLGGVVQVNTETEPDRPCLMDLRVLGQTGVIRISQNLGRHASGCRLDATGLETAVGRVAAHLEQDPPQLMILNKFGKQEAEGRGFRPVIAEALARGVPVLTGVSQKNRACFDMFAQELAQALPPEEDAVLEWCVAQIGPAASSTVAALGEAAGR
ncbi:DUF2478 domain-containing protein [Pseudotabrizicola algicola]|uniref:DUF2478 domain-containing protein n=1 Tax=Pseudotabrizicola algicola TaxID=2709381 RepID=A0A6B3RMW0_9RHOB|nr:DUF2478 domain-containing protein [Pseudotabrizicola algicola]NEX46188.1 DUF2478 domain-containing protein [Pseudotabrizicola algicola]